jgi:hypothetical protein
MAADITSASNAPRKRASRDAEMTHCRLRREIAAEKELDASVFNGIKEKFQVFGVA